MLVGASMMEIPVLPPQGGNGSASFQLVALVMWRMLALVQSVLCLLCIGFTVVEVSGMRVLISLLEWSLLICLGIFFAKGD